MIKRFLPLLILVLLITGCVKKEKIELRLAHFFPGTHPAETKFISVWSQKISEATNNRVKITRYPAESLLKAPDIYNGVVTGITDIGLACFSYTRGRFPVLEVFELPGITYLNSKSASMTAWEGIDKLKPAEIQDTKLLMVIATGPGHIFSKSAVRNLEDLKGLEIRATGLSAKTLEVLGAVPNGMPQSETYEALSKGVVKGNLSPVEVLKGWKHAEVVKYVTLTPFIYNTLFFVTMNQQKWNSIPSDLQQIISDVTKQFFEETAIGLWDMQNEGAIEWAVEEHKVEVIELSEKETNRLIEKISPLQKGYTEMMMQKGLIDKDIIPFVKELADKYNLQYK